MPPCRRRSGQPLSVDNLLVCRGCFAAAVFSAHDRLRVSARGSSESWPFGQAVVAPKGDRPLFVGPKGASASQQGYTEFNLLGSSRELWPGGWEEVEQCTLEKELPLEELFASSDFKAPRKASEELEMHLIIWASTRPPAKTSRLVSIPPKAIINYNHVRPTFNGHGSAELKPTHKPSSFRGAAQHSRVYNLLSHEGPFHSKIPHVTRCEHLLGSYYGFWFKGSTTRQTKYACLNRSWYTLGCTWRETKHVVPLPTTRIHFSEANRENLALKILFLFLNCKVPKLCLPESKDTPHAVVKKHFVLMWSARSLCDVVSTEVLCEWPFCSSWGDSELSLTCSPNREGWFMCQRSLGWASPECADNTSERCDNSEWFRIWQFRIQEWMKWCCFFSTA